MNAILPAESRRGGSYALEMLDNLAPRNQIRPVTLGQTAGGQPTGNQVRSQALGDEAVWSHVKDLAPGSVTMATTCGSGSTASG